MHGSPALVDDAPDLAWAPAWVMRLTETIAMERAMPGVTIHAVPPDQGGFQATFITIPLGDFVLQAGRTTALSFVGTVDPGVVVLSVPRHDGKTLVWDGRAITEEGVFGVFVPGAQLVRRNSRASEFSVLVTTAANAMSLLGLPEHLFRGPPQGRRFQASANDWRALSSIIFGACTVAEAAPDVFATVPPRIALRASLIEAAERIIASACPRGDEAGVSVSGAWSRIVVGAEDYLNAHLDAPIYTDELCRMLHVSPSCLGDAFRATLGISPHRYLKLRRLNLVRAALLRHAGTTSLIKSVALAHGFWHLGQFTRDYRAQFGETPSATLRRRTRSQAVARYAGGGLGKAPLGA